MLPLILINEAITKIELDPKEHKFKTHIISSLKQIANNIYDFQDVSDTLFGKHFIKNISKSSYDEDIYFELFEELAIIFREKELRGKTELANTYLLNEFEACGEWGADDNSLVSKWYWFILPLRKFEEQISISYAD